MHPIEQLSAMRQTVEGVLAGVRPCLVVDGGDVQLVDIVDGVVTVRLVGGLGGCPMSKMALACGLEHKLKQAVEGIKQVVIVRK